ncbi:hypothetical protein CPB83DRAFT_898580 [Crepidotus variabilis]|uniref:Uncharacterized protein n=1 Tax=Crepidotus variabilis TaxID=179855 RepID=A0A9P6E6Y3_9AGAR|nr:hypothetical protein CPB83DRAFT_898580 [Crepidotus variabilis]
MTAPPPANAPKLQGDGEKVVVKQSCTTLYYDSGDQALYKIIDTHFDGYEWVFLKSFDNTSSQIQTYTYTMSTNRVITTGSSFNDQWDFVSEVNGLQIQYDNTTKTFVDEETKTSTDYDITIAVDANSQIYLYQKRYKFIPKVWFVLDAWNQLWTVGNWKSAGVAEETGGYYVDSNENLTHGSQLSDTQDLSVTEATITYTQVNIKQFQDCTTKCQDYLHDRGV